MTPHSYSHKFAGGYRCTFTLEADGTAADWTPANPPQNWPHWRAYYRWRDRSCADYAVRTGVLFTITLDVPWIGVRSYELGFRDSDAVFTYAHAKRVALVAAERAGRMESNRPPGLHEARLAELERVMLATAPHAAGASA